MVPGKKAKKKQNVRQKKLFYTLFVHILETYFIPFHDRVGVPKIENCHALNQLMQWALQR